MKNICRNCKHSNPLSTGFIDKSLKAQADMVTEKQKVIGTGKIPRLNAVKKVVEKSEYSEHINLHGSFSMVRKKLDGDGDYVSCSNTDHLMDEKGKKEGIVHKYYFSCTYFEGDK